MDADILAQMEAIGYDNAALEEQVNSTMAYVGGLEEEL